MLREWVIGLGAIASGFFLGVYWGAPAEQLASAASGNVVWIEAKEESVLRSSDPQTLNSEPSNMAMGSVSVGNSSKSEDTVEMKASLSQERASEELIYDVDNFLPPSRPPTHIGEDLTNIPDP